MGMARRGQKGVDSSAIAGHFSDPTFMRIYVAHNSQNYIGTLIEVRHSDSRVYYGP